MLTTVGCLLSITCVSHHGRQCGARLTSSNLAVDKLTPCSRCKCFRMSLAICCDNRRPCAVTTSHVVISSPQLHLISPHLCLIICPQSFDSTALLSCFLCCTPVRAKATNPRSGINGTYRTALRPQALPHMTHCLTFAITKPCSQKPQASDARRSLRWSE